MLYPKLALTLLSTTVLIGCNSTPTMYPTDTEVRVSGSTLIFDGIINGNAVLHAIRLARTSEDKITTLKITSAGGDIQSGMELGYFIHEEEMNVLVSDLCFSSCANYIMTAANHVTIEENSIIGWHGSAKQADDIWRNSIPKSAQESFFAYLGKMREMEDRFFDVMEVDEMITVYGQIDQGSCQKRQQTDGWFYSIGDLKHMGLNNITIEGDLLTEKKGENSILTSCQMKPLFNQ